MARLGSVSSLEPACRLLCLALLSSASLLSGPAFAAALALAATAFLLVEGLSFPTICREASFIALFAVFSTALRFVGVPGAAEPLGILGEAGVYALRLLSAFLAGRLFYATTSSSELRDAATRVARRIPFLRRFDLGLGLALVVGFIPLIFDEWKASLEASRSRGMPKRPRLSTQASFVSAFLRRLMLRAVSVPEALVARGWTRERGLTPSRWRTRDTVSSLACASLAVLSALRVV